MTTIGGNFLLKKEPTVEGVLILFNDAWSLAYLKITLTFWVVVAKKKVDLLRK